MLAFPNFNAPSFIEKLVSSVALAGTFTQKEAEINIHHMQDASHTMKSTERIYSACERKALAAYSHQGSSDYIYPQQNP